ncbi:low affinity high capacity ammonium permease [Ascochyta rabiei]|uniref:Extracellular metalloproteinase n=1 Tax=Didymella rabiei TaxID=5454 RepID=A0A163G6G2_DIDRA|nr:low affinity high capacity ammonium permease [Ascochyta rabiei]KZM24704.1 metalloendopeptidase [Ascochyta rabiei]UPX16731.1 low affinity high capacity ammonium permease [Ascochyta rabiei]
MYASLVVGLFLSTVVGAHPTAHDNSLVARAIDLNAFRLKPTSKYVNASVAESPSVRLRRREDYVETATELVKSIANGATFRVVGDHYVGANGIAHVNFKQTAHDLDIDNADFNVNVGKDGSIFSYGNSFFTGKIPDSPLTKREFSDPVDALKAATNILQLPVKADQASAETAEGKETFTLKGTSGAVKDPEAKLMYLVKADGSLALTWRVETDIMSNWLLTYVDAASNTEVHGVIDYSADAVYQVYPWGLNDPTEGSRVLISDPWDTKASEFTWQGTGTTTYKVTRGNNAIAQNNPSGGNNYLNNLRPSSPTSNFSYPYTSSMTPPSTYVNASITQLFYTVNTYHDLLYTLGFTEQAGNFEVNNNGQGGAGNDFAILNAQDGSGTNNANFATPPDGQPGRMRMYLWTSSTPQRDCTFEAGVVIHEYTHGLSTRLTGGPANSNCLNALEAGGMGEGWGDFMATAIRLKPADTRAKNYPMGAWVYNDPVGIRSYLYSTSLTTNPLTYTSLNELNEVHAIGEAWANVLYEVMWNLIDKHGKNDAAKPTFDADGVPTDGKYLTMKLVIDAMALQPCNPTFVQARDAILDADTALTGGANKCDIWKAFAKRGLGTGAKYSSAARTGSTALPSGC